MAFGELTSHVLSWKTDIWYFLVQVASRQWYRRQRSRLVIRRLLVRFPVEASLSKTLNPLIAPDVPVCHQCKCKKMCIHPCKSLWIKATYIRATYNVYTFYISTDGTLHIRSN